MHLERFQSRDGKVQEGLPGHTELRAQNRGSERDGRRHGRGHWGTPKQGLYFT